MKNRLYNIHFQLQLTILKPKKAKNKLSYLIYFKTILTQKHGDTRKSCYQKDIKLIIKIDKYSHNMEMAAKKMDGCGWNVNAILRGL